MSMIPFTQTSIAMLCKSMPEAVCAQWAAALEPAAERWEINTPARAAMWMANLLHESTDLSRLEENLNYSAKRMAQVWPGRFSTDPRAIDKTPNELAHRLAFKPDAFANEVYANRMGNGAPATGHGWLYRGRYPTMLTGKSNYEAANDALGIIDLANPDALLDDIPGMAQVSGWFWKANGCSHYADANDFDGVCDKINRGHKTEAIGDSVGWKDRLDRYFACRTVFGA